MGVLPTSMIGNDRIASVIYPCPIKFERPLRLVDAIDDVVCLVVVKEAILWLLLGLLLLIKFGKLALS
jgi:hypothetical protein